MIFNSVALPQYTDVVSEQPSLLPTVRAVSLLITFNSMIIDTVVALQEYADVVSSEQPSHCRCYLQRPALLRCLAMVLPHAVLAGAL